MCGQIVALDQQHGKAAARGVARDARAIDAAADDQKVAGLLVAHRRSQVYRMRYDLPSGHAKRHAMNIVPEIAALDAEMRDWRHRLHAHPETAFEETTTSAFVAATLRSFGLDVHTGLAGTGVVGVLRNGGASTAVGLRADLDALHIHETSGVPHASK